MIFNKGIPNGVEYTYYKSGTKATAGYFENGKYSGEWQFWNTGQVDIFSLEKSIVLCVKLVVIGWLVISFLAFFLIRRSVKKIRRMGNTK